MRSALPQGRTLPADAWHKRHRALYLLLCLHALALPVYGLMVGYGAVHALEHGAVLAVLAAIAHALRRRRRLAALTVSLGLTTASALVVHLSGGLIEAHFHFFVLIVVLSLYEDWLPFLVSAAYVVVHHGLTGALDPGGVYNHPDAVAHPWKWALIHGAFVTAAGIASVVTWRLNESVREQERAALERARCSERALAARERETRHILESAHDAFISIDERGLVSDWNHQAATTFGWTREQVLGCELAELIIPERYRAAHRRGLERFLAGGQSTVLGTRLELEALDRSGREFPVEMTISPLQTGDGHAFYAFLHDISERRQASALLERRRRQLAEAQSVACLGSWEWNVSADVIEWSQELCRIYGLQPSAHPATLEAFIDLVHPDDRAAVRAATETACTSGDPYNIEHRLVRPDGTVRVTSAHGEVVMGDDGRPLRMFGTQQDITDRRQAEESQRQMAAIVDHCEEAIVASALDGTILTWNRGAQRVYGYNAAEALGKPITMLVPADRHEELGEVIAGIVRGESFEQHQTVRVRKDGHRIDVALTISPIKDGAGALSGASTIARDVSDQKARERYQRVQHEATRVLAQTATTQQALLALLQSIGEGMDWDVGAFWMPRHADDTELRCEAFWHRPGAAPDVFEAVTKQLVLTPGAGLLGCVWNDPKARWVPDVTVEPESSRADAAAADGLHACILLPVLAGSEVLAVIEFLSHEVRPSDAALLLMLEALAAPIAQFLERRRADEQLSHQARHDALTALPNRRKLLEDLELALAAATIEQPQLLLLLDLDGFKAYNDSFGHGAGDALLARFGQRLAETMHGRGTSYRMGGDEFCVIAQLGDDGPHALIERAREALSEHGDAFIVTASCGSALLPAQASNPTDALGLADRLMYAAKGRGTRTSAARQSTDVLLQVLSERSPQLGDHLDGVTVLCEAVAQALAVPEDQMSHLLQAASLHDVGKAAIPEAILDKPGPLSAHEWSYMRRHTLIGERILAVAPALVPAAKLVRSSHERVDGQGYPDGLAGEEIPLGSRIIAACDAYDAMIANRPYRVAMSAEGALFELHACAGTQFDLVVVEALTAVVAAHNATHR